MKVARTVLKERCGLVTNTSTLTALCERRDWVRSRKSPMNSCSLKAEYILPAEEPYPLYNLQAKRLTQHRKENEELKLVHSQVLQQTLKVLDNAFADVRKKGYGFPRYVRRSKSLVLSGIP